MINELHFQSQVIDDIIGYNPKSWAIKLAHRFLAGIPDLLIKVPDYDALFIETKVTRSTKNGIKVETTPLQRATMHMMNRAGLKVAVWVLVDGVGIVRCTYDVTEIKRWDNALTRVRGKGWPVEELLTNPTGV